MLQTSLWEDCCSPPRCWFLTFCFCGADLCMDSSDQLQHFLGQRGEKDPPLAVHQEPQVQKKKKILKETSASAGLPLSKQVLYIVLCPVYEACLFLKPWSSSRSWWTTAHNTRGSDFHISEDAVFRCKATFEQAETQERLLRKLNMVWISGMEFVTEKEGIEYTRSRTPLGLANAATDVSGSQTLLNILPPLNDTLILHF